MESFTSDARSVNNYRVARGDRSPEGPSGFAGSGTMVLNG